MLFFYSVGVIYFTLKAEGPGKDWETFDNWIPTIVLSIPTIWLVSDYFYKLYKERRSNSVGNDPQNKNTR